jgi:hypothetical protein
MEIMRSPRFWQFPSNHAYPSAKPSRVNDFLVVRPRAQRSSQIDKLAEVIRIVIR